VSTAHDSTRPKDEIRVVVGLCVDVWQGGEKEGLAMLESKYGRILVLAVDEPRGRESEGPPPEDYEPLMLLALNGSPTASWDDLKSKGNVLASHLARPLSRYREHLASPKSPSMAPSTG